MRSARMIFLASLLLSGPALAADDLQGNAAAGLYDWSGYYVGIQAGVNINDSQWTATGGAPFDINGESFLIGGQAGYLRQFDNNWIVGAEAELSGTSLTATGQCATVVGSVCRTRQDWVAAFRGRIGYAFDRLQVYGTAGVALTDYRHDQTAAITQSWDDGSTRFGWTAGLGAEYALTNTWSAGLEWKHYDFGSKTGTGGTAPVNVDFKETSDHFVAKLNYRF